MEQGWILSPDGWVEDGGEGGEDVVSELPALGVIHPQPLPHRVVNVDLQELVWPVDVLLHTVT